MTEREHSSDDLRAEAIAAATAWAMALATFERARAQLSATPGAPQLAALRLRAVELGETSARLERAIEALQ